MERQEIIERSQCKDLEFNYPDIFTDDCGLGYEAETERNGVIRKLRAVPTWGYRKQNEKRRVTLKISTYRGQCADAIHYYVEMYIQGVNMEFVDEPGHSTMSGGWEKDNPLSSYSYSLTLTRAVTQADKDEDEKAFCEAEKHYEYYRVGQQIPKFNTLKDVHELAMEVFKARFSGNWELWIDAPFKDSRERKIAELNGNN